MVVIILLIESHCESIYEAITRFSWELFHKSRFSSLESQVLIFFLQFV